jgi:4-hydroxybutyrate CoA-transferase
VIFAAEIGSNSQKTQTMNWTSADDALKVVRSNDKLFFHTACAFPQLLANALAERKSELNNVQIYQLHTEGSAPYGEEDCEGSFHINAFFVGKSTRAAVHSSRGSYIPIFLSEIPFLFKHRSIELDVALISVSPPDKHGYCSLGPSVDVTLAAIKNAKTVIAQVNSFMPRSHGDGLIHVSRINFLVEGNQPLPESEPLEISEVEHRIGEQIVNLIEDGSTLQMGIGAIPNAVLSALGNHNDLCIHSEMFSDGILPLVEKGVITGSTKKEMQGLVVGSFAVGSKKLFDFIDDNPLVRMMESSYVNQTDVIRRLQKMVAINSAIEIDLTGQVCADSIGSTVFSGVGGQMDFIRGASLSKGGKPIIALASTTRKGESKLVPMLKTGAGVVTTRAHVHWVVTEFGAVNLYGKTIAERMKLLISIAHPAHREELEKASRLLKN